MPRVLVFRRPVPFEALVFALLRAAVPPALRAVDARVAPVPEDLARAGFLRVAAAFLAPVARELDEAFLAVEPRVDAAVDALPPIAPHFPDMTRSAASATASAISDPSLVALETTLLAARSALSAASRPASRIFLRAAGLALIAAAAAARPAASISLLIAALAILSIVSLLLERDDFFDPDFEDVERDELLRADLAIA